MSNQCYLSSITFEDEAELSFKPHKGDENCPLFVNKQQLLWSTLITLENNNTVLIRGLYVLYITSSVHASVGLTGSISMVISV